MSLIKTFENASFSKNKLSLEVNTMSLFITSTPNQRSLARRRMWEQLLTDESKREQFQVAFPVDVRSNEEGYILNAFLPGVTAEDLDIQVVNDTITIQGEIKVERKEDEHYLLSERPSGKFKRTIELPDELDSDKAEAELKNGVLTLSVPKSELAKPRKIKISNN
jgi:HSP20 family protein